MSMSDVASFCTAAQLHARYAVSEHRLLAYAQRGNLSMRRIGSLLLFDERDVARLFPRRGTSQQALGRLGFTRLGDRSDR